MKIFSVTRVCMPALVVGAAFALAPQSRAQEVAPDQFAIVPNAASAATTIAQAAAVQPSASAATLHANKKPGARLTPANSAKNVSGAQKPKVVAVQDKRKIPASQPNQ